MNRTLRLAFGSILVRLLVPGPKYLAYVLSQGVGVTLAPEPFFPLSGWAAPGDPESGGVSRPLLRVTLLQWPWPKAPALLTFS
ncbi:hypothetical protein HNQ07_004034 [Deinococcus metalli]|uniref:Uncharacterized protein n=1 Tax=Deinococcus metalli TaxID=1141878 RepID=A0A7W8KI39_9DEIO|nr:hypothetical protein [Deinococcus metalli]